MNQKYFLCLCHFPHFCSLWGFFILFFLKMSNSHWAAHWRSCGSLVWFISIEFLTMTAGTKDLLQGNLTRGQFYIKGRAKGHGKKKERKKKKNTITKENQKTTPSKQKRRYTECPLKVLLEHASCWLFTLNIISYWRNEEQQRINECSIHLQQMLTTVTAGLEVLLQLVKDENCH